MVRLRNIIRQLIKEGIKESQLQDLALFHYEATTGKHHYMLFHPKLVVHILNTAHHFGKSSVSLSSTKALKEIAKSRHIYAMMIANHRDRKSPDNPCFGAWEITLAGAEAGWGPTMYDIVMGDSPDGIMSDRYEVSTSAKPVWDFYYKNREDVEKYVLDSSRYKWTDYKMDDCEWGSAGDYSEDMKADHEELDFHDFKDEAHELWYRDTLNYVYNDWEVKHRMKMEDNFSDVVSKLQNHEILTGTRVENYLWWRKIMLLFFNIQSQKRNY